MTHVDIADPPVVDPPTGSDVAIRCVGVVKRFGPVVALNNLELEVPIGSITGFLGPNGAGKTTMLRILVDLARADAGDVRIWGSDPHRAGPTLRHRLGYLPGELRLDDRLDVAETLRYWSTLRGGVDAAYVAHLCERLALDPTRPTHGLSSGNRRKVGLVGAFMSRPDLLVLDEPTAGLDPLVQNEFEAMVREAREAGQTILLSSHVLSEVQQVADRVVLIRAGRTILTGVVEQLRRDTRHRFAVWFEAAVPEDELRAVPGVSDLVVLDTQARGLIEGSPDPFLAVLTRHRVTHLVMPEPDLEEAFLRYYHEDRR